MKRWYLCPIVSTVKGLDTYYRPKVMQYAHGRCDAIIVSNTDGTPRFNWALCMVEDGDWAAMNADSELRLLFDGGLNSTLSSLSAAARTNLQNFLTARGVDLTGITAASTFRAVVKRIYKRLSEDSDERVIDTMEQ